MLASDSSTSDMHLEDPPPYEATGKRRRKRRLRRLVRRNGGGSTNGTDDLVLAMLAAEPPVDLAGQYEMDASEILETMYLADEERQREEALTSWPIPPPAATGVTP